MLAEAERITFVPLASMTLPSPLTIRSLVKTVLACSSVGRDVIAPVQAGLGPPLFFCHGDYGTRGFYALALAPLLGAEQGLVLINPKLDFDDWPTPTLEQMARAYLPHVLAAQPEGPLTFGGYSIGGLLAWELARQATESGREVTRVILVDSVSLNARPSMRALKLGLSAIRPLLPHRSRPTFDRDALPAVWHALWRVQRLTLPRLVRAVRSAFHRLRHALRGEDQDKAASRAGLGNRNLHTIYFKMMCNYVPPRLKLPIACVVSHTGSQSAIYDVRPWRRIASRTTTSVVPGDHQECVTTYAPELAQRLREALKA
jgi:thioesterase domain-containing protein